MTCKLWFSQRKIFFHYHSVSFHLLLYNWFPESYVCCFRHVLYLSTLCDNDDDGKKALLSAMTTLIKPPVSENLQSDSVAENDDAEAKPSLLWRALYVQELVKV